MGTADSRIRTTLANGTLGLGQLSTDGHIGFQQAKSLRLNGVQLLAVWMLAQPMRLLSFCRRSGPDGQ